MTYYVYILKCQNGRYYIGHTNNLNHRLHQHQTNNHGSKHTKDFIFSNFLYHETFSNRATAMKREKQIKGWSRKKKEALMQQDYTGLKRLGISRMSPRFKVGDTK